VWFGSNSTPQFIEEVGFEVPDRIPTGRHRPATATNVVIWFCFAARYGERRMVEVGGSAGRAQGPPWSLPCSPVATWVEEKAEGRQVVA